MATAFADLIVGAYREGRLVAVPRYVVFGKASGFAANLDSRPVDGSNGFKISGVAAFRLHAGTSVASAGDVNGDGFDDLIVGAYRADPHGTNSGASYVVFGKASGFAANLDLSTLDGTNGFKISGDAASTSGLSVASAGDVNGDGFDDLIIGAPGPTRTATEFRRELCGVRQGGGLWPPISTSRPSTAATASSSAATRRLTGAAIRSPRRATSMATASPT